MSTKTTETRLREALATVASDISATLEFDQILGRLETEVAPASDYRRNRLLAAAAGLIVVAAVSFTWLQASDDDAFDLDSTDSTNTTQVQEELPDPLLPFVLPGEIVVSEEPLVVHAAEGPEPQFDTSVLGEEQAFQPLSDGEIDQILERVNRDEKAQGATHVKTVLLGSVGTIDWAVNIADQAAEESSKGDGASGSSATTRCRTLRSPGSSRTRCEGTDPEGLDMIQPGPISAGPGNALTTEDGFIAWSMLPAEASVTVVEAHSGDLWQRPRNGVVAFQVELTEGDSILFRVMDATGAEIYRGRFTAEDDTPDDYFGPELIYSGPEPADGLFNEVTPPPLHYVLDGEVVLREDPLIVQAAPGPEPSFDTGDLGTEIVVVPVEDAFDPRVQVLLGEWREQALAEHPEAVPIKFIVVGEVTLEATPGALRDDSASGLVVIGVSDHRFGLESSDRSPDTNVRTRWISAPDFAFSFGGRVVRSSLGLLVTEPLTFPVNDPLRTSGYSTQSFIWDGVPSNVSVVIWENSEEQLWTRPYGGLVRFLIDPSYSGSSLITALDAEGNEIVLMTTGTR